jgi:DNA-binding MarR family transcriptional regulator
MTAHFEELFALDRLVHEPAHLAILTVLEACRSSDLLFLRCATGLPEDDLRRHVARLDAAGLVLIAQVGRRRPRTTVSLTADGRERLRQYWACLGDARRAVAAWRLFNQGPATVS